MPLPPLLAERLRKRGILLPEHDTLVTESAHHQQEPSSSAHPGAQSVEKDTANLTSKEVQTSQDVVESDQARVNEEQELEEEIIAEDFSDSSGSDRDQDSHDERSSHGSASPNPQGEEEASSTSSESKDNVHRYQHHQRDFAKPTMNAPVGHSLDPNTPLGPHSYLKCPNKYNIYHTCTQYCRQMYVNKSDVPNGTKKAQLMALLQRFPLSPEWRPVYDPGVETFYFWNTITDQVSWLPFSHPDARATYSANRLRETMSETQYEGRSSSGPFV